VHQIAIKSKNVHNFQSYSEMAFLHRMYIQFVNIFLTSETISNGNQTIR